MKNINKTATYESPMTELLNLEVEGCVLANSTTSSHNPFTTGDDINF